MLADMLEKRIDDLAILKTATSFSREHGYLMFGTACDSSQRYSERYKWIQKALDEKVVKEYILSIALRLCTEDLESEKIRLHEIICTSKEV